MPVTSSPSCHPPVPRAVRGPGAGRSTDGSGRMPNHGLAIPHRSRALAMKPEDAKSALRALISDLRAISQRDQEQEVRGMALPVLDSVLEAAKEHVRDDPVVQTIREA